MARKPPAGRGPEQPAGPLLADVLAVLAAGGPLDGLAAAITHSATLAAGDPAPARELEVALRRRVADARLLVTAQAWRGTVGRAAQTAHATVLVAALGVGRGGAREEGPAPGWVREALDEVLLAALGRDDGPDREGHAAHVADLASTWARTRLLAELDVATALLALLEERARPPRARWAARLALEGVSRRKGRELTAIDAAANRCLEQVLNDRAEPEELRELALASAHRFLPDLDVEDLQRRGLVATLPLPPSTAQPHALRPLFDAVDRDQLRRVLDQGTDAPLLTTALALTPHLVLRWPARWRDWEPRVRALLDRVPAATGAYVALLPALEPWKAELLGHLPDVLRRALPGLTPLDALAVAARKLYGPKEPLEPLAQLLLDAVRGAPALPWERRLLCYSVLVERWSERASLGDEALADVLAATGDELTFWRGLGVLARRRCDLISQRVESGALGRRPLPSVELLHVAGGNQYDGFYCEVVADRVKAAVALVDREQALAPLERADDPGRACTAMHLLPLLVAGDPALARRAEDAAVALVTDARIHQGQVESTGQHTGSRKEGFPLAPAARELLLTLAARADAGRQAELALACLARVLAPEHVASAHESDLKDLLRPWSQRPGIELATWAALGRALADAAGDRRRPTPVRLRAYEALRHAEGLKGLAATLDPELARAKAALVASLRTPRDEDPALVDYVRTNLASIDPDAVAALQVQGHIAVEGVPPLAELLDPSSSSTSRQADAAAVRLAGIAARPEQVIGALRGRDPDAVLAALLLAPEVASRASWKELAAALLLHVSGDGFSEAAVIGESRSKLALRHLVATVDLPARAGDLTARGHLLEALTRIIGATAGNPWEVEQCLQACVTPLVACKDAADLLGLVRSWLLDRSRSTTVRFRALRLLLEHRDPAAKERLLPLLHDRTDDPALRALAGTLAWTYAQPELEPLLSMKERPWTLAPAAPRLPISSPADVPTDWLIATLELARDADTRRTALWRLELRLAVGDDLPGMSQRLRRDAARHRGLVAVLRARLDEGLSGTWDSTARWAAQLLALLGRAPDTGRVALAALRCSWHVPCGDCGASHESPSAKVRGQGRSELDAHIAAGFRAGADRARARAWLELGRAHVAAGRHDEARDALRAALELAPRSREIARELRAARA